MINAANVIDQQGCSQDILGRDFRPPIMPQDTIIYPPSTQVTRFKIEDRNTSLAYFRFIWHVLMSHSSEADLFIGYDMHGLLPAWILAKLHGRPLVYHCHDYSENGTTSSTGQRVVKSFERLLARTADLVIVPDQERAEVMVRELRLGTSPLIVANAPLAAPPTNQNKLAEALHQQGKDFSRIVFRQGRRSGHAIEVTLRSMPHWAIREWGFVIMGPCEEDYRKSLERLAADME